MLLEMAIQSRLFELQLTTSICFLFTQTHAHALQTHKNRTLKQRLFNVVSYLVKSQKNWQLQLH